MPKRRWSKRRVVCSGFVVIRRFSRFEGAGGARWSTSASACAIPTMRTSMAVLGKAVSSAVSFGRHEITKGMRKTRSIGQDIEWWWKANEAQISGTKKALYRAFLDSLARQYFFRMVFANHLGPQNAMLYCRRTVTTILHCGMLPDRQL